MEDARSAILATAKELFFEQGYKNTTIRQIVDRSGVLTGSIYHFFKNKEDILKSIMIDLFDLSDNLVVKHFGEDISPSFRYACLCTFELEGSEMDDRTCELLFEAYSLNTIFDGIVYRATDLTQTIFHTYNPTFTYEDFYVLNLAIKGVMRSFIANRYLRENIPLATRINTLLDISLHAFNVTPLEIEAAKSQLALRQSEIQELINSINIYEQIESAHNLI